MFDSFYLRNALLEGKKIYIALLNCITISFIPLSIMLYTVEDTIFESELYNVPVQNCLETQWKE